MPVLRTYRCPDCAGMFEVLHRTWDAAPPDECALCHAWMGEAEAELPKINLGGSALSKSVDAVQKGIEGYGQSNMKDGLREGDTAGIMPSNDVTKVQQMMAEKVNYSPFGGGQGPSAQVQSYVAMAKQPVNGVKTTGAVALAAIQNQNMNPKSLPLTRERKLTAGADRPWRS